MASVHWIGGATAVAQVSAGSVDSVDGTPANNTFTVTVGDGSVGVAGDTDANTTAAALVSALNSSTHPHIAQITWSNSTDDVTGTADTAGVPFVAALTVSGAGSGTVTDFSDTTASSGPTDYGTAANWSGGAVPVASDDVTIDKSGEKILFGLDQSAVAINSLTIRGNVIIGLRTDVFTSTSDESTTLSTAVEYRQSYLKIDCPRVNIGQYLGVGTVVASQRTKIEQASTSDSVITVYNTAAGASESGLPAFRMLAASANCDLVVRNAPGGAGIAAERDETSTIGIVSVIDTGASSRVVCGDGTTITEWSQRSGTNLLQAAATVTTVSIDDGILTVEGDFTITTVNVRGGTVRDNHTKTSGSIITTLNLDGGTIDLQRNREARTISTVNHEGGALLGNEDLTVTTYNEPTSGDYQITAS